MSLSPKPRRCAKCKESLYFVTGQWLHYVRSNYTSICSVDVKECTNHCIYCGEKVYPVFDVRKDDFIWYHWYRVMNCYDKNNRPSTVWIATPGQTVAEVAAMFAPDEPEEKKPDKPIRDTTFEE